MDTDTDTHTDTTPPSPTRPRTLTVADRACVAAGFMHAQIIHGAADMTDEQLLAAAADTLGAPDNVIQTHETLADFASSHGQPTKTWMVGARKMHQWRRVQMRFGRARGDLYLMEFDGVSGSIFTGERP